MRDPSPVALAAFVFAFLAFVVAVLAANGVFGH